MGEILPSHDPKLGPLLCGSHKGTRKRHPTLLGLCWASAGSWEAERTLCQLCRSIWQPNWPWNKIAQCVAMITTWLILFVTLFRLVLCCSSPVKCFTRELWDNPLFALTMPRSAHCFIFRLTAWIRFVLRPISGSSVRFLLFPGRQLIHWVLGMAFGEMKISTGRAEVLAE